MGNSSEPEVDAIIDPAVNPDIAHVFGSISSATGSSNAALGKASLGISKPLYPKADGFGFIIMRGHSTDKLSKESLSTFGC